MSRLMEGDDVVPLVSDSSESDSESAPVLSRRRRRQSRSPSWRSQRTTAPHRRWLRACIRHPLFPTRPTTILLALVLFALFAVSLTLFLKYALNPDKEPLPWRTYCSVPSLSQPFNRPATADTPFFLPNVTAGRLAAQFPPDNLDSLAPAGIFLAVFTIDAAFDRRMLIRTTWARHHRSRNGSGAGDGGVGTSRTIVRFVLGQPRGHLERRIMLEQEMYHDLVILPMAENMNDGKTNEYFTWAATNAWVPPVYNHTGVTVPKFSYSSETTSPPVLARHDSLIVRADIDSGKSTPWVRPDMVLKMDDDAFVMLAELEARLRVHVHESRAPAPAARPSTDDPLIYWGYLVTNRLHTFMAGELYGLSWSLTQYAATDPTVKTWTRGKEDKQTAKWMRRHPRASEVVWAYERCWIYDHPRAGTVYSHGFLFPSEVSRVREKMMAEFGKALDELDQRASAGTIAGDVGATALSSWMPGGRTWPETWTHSTVSTWGIRYRPPLGDLTPAQSVEALAEGSKMSLLHYGKDVSPDEAWRTREGRSTRYGGKRVGGTVAVHFIKKPDWYIETALALLEGDEFTEEEKLRQKERG